MSHDLPQDGNRGTIDWTAVTHEERNRRTYVAPRPPTTNDDSEGDA